MKVNKSQLLDLSFVEASGNVAFDDEPKKCVAITSILGNAFNARRRSDEGPSGRPHQWAEAGSMSSRTGIGRDLWPAVNRVETNRS
jgi:hypothetical protein